MKNIMPTKKMTGPGNAEDLVKNVFLLPLCLLALIFTGSLKAEEGDLYDFLWLDPDKEVYVLQNKVYKKTSRNYFNASYLMGQSNEYFDTTGFQALGGHYLSEQWALEVFYNKYSNSQNGTYKNLKEINGAVPFSRQLQQSYGAMALWSPFYGKINTFNKIFYFDWSVGIGAGKVTTESNAKTVADPDESDTYMEEDHTALFLKTGVRFHATENIHLELNLLRTQYQAPGPIVDGVQKKDKWRGHSDIVIGIGFSF